MYGASLGAGGKSGAAVSAIRSSMEVPGRGFGPALPPARGRRSAADTSRRRVWREFDSYEAVTGATPSGGAQRNLSCSDAVAAPRHIGFDIWIEAIELEEHIADRVDRNVVTNWRGARKLRPAVAGAAPPPADSSATWCTTFRLLPAADLPPPASPPTPPLPTPPP